MYRKNNNLLSKRDLTSVFCLILLLFPSFVGLGIDYHFIEDFTDPDPETWFFQGTDWSGENVTRINDSFTVSNGELVASGEKSSSKLNGAYILDTTTVGTWSIEVFVPSDAQIHTATSRIWGLIFSEQRMGPEPNSTRYGQFGINIRNNFISLWAFNGTPNIIIDESFPFDEQKFDQKQVYDVIRSENNLYVFVDKSLVFNNTLPSSIGSSLNYLTIVVAQGSNVRFDNLKITSEVDEILLNSISQTTTGFPFLVTLIIISVISIKLKKNRSKK